MKAYNIELWTQLSLDIIYEDLNGIPQLGEESRAKNIDFQLGGGVSTYAIVLNRFGMDVNLHFYSNDSLVLNNLALDTLNKLEFYNVQKHPVSFNPVDVTSVMSTKKDRAFVSYTESLATQIDRTLWAEINESSDVVYLNSEISHDVLNKDFSNKLVFYSVGYEEAKNNSKIIECIEKSDYFVLNDLEAKMIFKQESLFDCLDELDKMIQLPIISLGSKGCISKIDNKYYNFHLKEEVIFKDATGAGDNFFAGLMYSVLSNKSKIETIKFAIACGSLSVQGIGAYGYVYTLQEVQEFIDNIEYVVIDRDWSYND